MEKLLRSCPDVGAIYMLVRPKKGKSSKERVKEIINTAVCVQFYTPHENACALRVDGVQTPQTTLTLTYDLDLVTLTIVTLTLDHL